MSVPVQRGSKELTRALARAESMLAVRVLAVTAWVAAALIGLIAMAWPASLVAALAVMAVFVALETTIFRLWAAPYLQGLRDELAAALDEGRENDIPAPATEGGAVAINVGSPNGYADAAKVAITTQGVVLGLVALKGGQLPNVTVKVGACALVAGVLVATVLYLLVSLGPPEGVDQRFTAGLLFSLVFWCLGFGLVCVVAGIW